MIWCKETLSEHVYKYKNPGKAVLSANVSRVHSAGSRSVKEILPALHRSAVPHHVTAQQRYCKQVQVQVY